MDIDVEQIESDSGQKIVFASLVGSRVYGLETETSDYDYAAYVVPGSDRPFDPDAIYRYKTSDDLPKCDIFLRLLKPVVQFYSSIMMIPTYTSIMYADNRIVDFINEHRNGLCNLSPYNTYRIALEHADRNLNYGRVKRQLITIRDCGIIHNFMQSGDFEKCLYLDGDFLEIYRDLHDNPESTITTDNIRELISFMYKDSTRAFFREFKPNYDLFNSLISKVEEVANS